MTWTLSQIAETRAGPVAWGTAGSGPPLIVAHGWPWSSWSWHAVLPALTDHFTVYWYDMPGFGRSMVADGTPTGLDVQGEVFAEMVRYWSLTAPAVWAHDFGGAVTLRARLLHGTEIGHHLLMNVVAMRPWGSDFFTHVGLHLDAFLGLPPHIHAAVVDAYIRGALAGDLPDDWIATLSEPWLSERGKSAFYAQFAQADEAFTAEVEPLFPTLPAPIRVLWGADDPWIPLVRGHTLSQVIGCRFEAMDGLGHLAQLEDPERAVSRALAFFNEAA